MDDLRSDVQRDAEERRAVRRTTVEQRRDYIARRRERFRERDADRLRWAERFAGAAGPQIAVDVGFLTLPAGSFADVIEPVVAVGNALIADLGHTSLVEHGGKSDFIARGFLPQSAFAIDSPYLRLALDERIVGLVSRYLGVVPVLTDVDLWYSVHQPNAPKRSQLWHLDSDDTTIMKVWIHLSDVDARSGPLTAFNAADSATLADALGYNYADGYRVTDDRVNEIFGPEHRVSLVGPPGTVDFIDTCRCFHFGSRVSAEGVPRRVLVLEYQTPYSFEFANHGKEATYRRLIPSATTDLQRLLLGACD